MVLASSAQVCRYLVGRDGRAGPGLACCADPRVYQFPDGERIWSLLQSPPKAD